MASRLYTSSLLPTTMTMIFQMGFEFWVVVALEGNIPRLKSNCDVKKVQKLEKYKNM